MLYDSKWTPEQVEKHFQAIESFYNRLTDLLHDLEPYYKDPTANAMYATVYESIQALVEQKVRIYSLYNRLTDLLLDLEPYCKDPNAHTLYALVYESIQELVEQKVRIYPLQDTLDIPCQLTVQENGEYHLRFDSSSSRLSIPGLLHYKGRAEAIRSQQVKTAVRNWFYTSVEKAVHEQKKKGIILHPIRRCHIDFIFRYRNGIWDVDHYMVMNIVNALKINGLIEGDNHKTMKFTVTGIEAPHKQGLDVYVRKWEDEERDQSDNIQK